MDGANVPRRFPPKARRRGNTRLGCLPKARRGGTKARLPAPTRQAFCPVASLEAWLDAASGRYPDGWIRAEVDTSGPRFADDVSQDEVLAALCSGNEHRQQYYQALESAGYQPQSVMSRVSYAGRSAENVHGDVRALLEEAVLQDLAKLDKPESHK